MQDSLRVYGVTGAGIALVTRDSMIWAGGIGIADPTRNQAVTAETHFRLGSITKTFTAVAVMQLVDRGLLDLNSHLADVTPDVAFVNPWEAQSPLRVLHLLQHTAGFDNRYAGTINRAELDVPVTRIVQLTGRARNVRWPPGSMAAYTNEAYSVAAYIVERLSGHRWEEELTTEILRPLRMPTSGFQLTDTGVPLAVGDGGRANMRTDYLLRQTMHASPAEMARFVRMFLGRGALDGTRVLSPSAVERMEQATMDSATGRRQYGLGLLALVFAPVLVYGHEGVGWGTNTLFAYSPELGFGLFVGVTQYQTPALRSLARLAFDFMARRTGNAFPPPPPGVSVGLETLRRYEGAYRRRSAPVGSGWWVPFVSIKVEDGSLVERFRLNPAVRLAALSDSVFRQEGRMFASRSFVEEVSGRMTLIRDLDEYERVPRVLAWLASGFQATVICALLLSASCIAFALVWIPRRVRRRLTDVTRLHVRWLPLAALAASAAATGMDVIEPDPFRGTIGSVTYAFLIALGVALGAAGIVAAARSKRDAGHWLARIHAGLASASILYLSLAAYFEF